LIYDVIRHIRMGVSGVRFDKQFSDAAKDIFTQAFKAGMQAALGF